MRIRVKGVSQCQGILAALRDNPPTVTLRHSNTSLHSDVLLPSGRRIGCIDTSEIVGVLPDRGQLQIYGGPTPDDPGRLYGAAVEFEEEDY